MLGAISIAAMAHGASIEAFSIEALARPTNWRFRGRREGPIRCPSCPARATLPMEAFLVSLSTVAIAEIGDRTQLLSLALAAHYRKPWAIIAGIFLATIANHAVAGVLGSWFGRLLTPTVLDVMVGASMVAMAAWVLRPDTLKGSKEVSDGNAFLATLVAFFIAEIGDKTQIATVALAAAYPNLIAVVAGTTTGMLIANVPAVFLGDALSGKLPIRQMNYVAALLFGVVGIVFIARALKLV
jgi:putative Ca2+/H+ antiporter (TMEM165/GDT1 family)